ncbi:exocyst complex component SEC15B [Elaeis guineensis]|uniref:Exocyst complex component n=1 Tax=Elaeis guineensis var. tenera TaxID=51953 RepID=A0A6I9RTM1_ELAGV|nr:exocyst complex component SEC15B [Elaeis guineensis]XP_010931668.1 exocyst complex component SEC15B [Elaeis guineensis]XP_010931669.1 exocyst complex component SEC15B [Elaeis guineensis]XP_010931670.1 exocyst complex component SEC15B [Elaeis guineensis]XP_010931671.1 exocyst complex component SEC15B [Elaeis guineensis]
MPRRVAPDSYSAAGGDAERQDLHQLSSAICNGEDLGPFVRKAFASGRPESLLHSLRHFARSKESEIEEVCKAHYQDFIRAVDDLRSLLSDVDSLKSALSDSNAALQSAAGPLLSSLDAYLEARAVARNLSAALAATRLCVRVLELLARANAHLAADDLYLALRPVDAVERDFLDAAPHPTIRRMLLHLIPAIRSHAERKIAKEFSDWMVQIRVASRHLGQVAIGRASAARQREEELRIRQRQAEEQSRLSLRDANSSSIYSLEEDDDSDDLAAAIAAASGSGAAVDGILGFDLTPLYRAYHIHQTLGLQDRFKQYYFENRKLQLTSDFQVSSMTPFLESHQTFFAQIAGFFIVEDRILRTGGGLISRSDVDALWETAIAKMVSVLEDQFSRMQTANHLLLIKDYVSLLGVTLRRYGYTVDPLLDVLSTHRDKYHDLLLSDCRRQVSEALAADKFEQMLMKKEYEYSMNVLSFQIQTSDITPAFPYVAPFSSTVPDLCRIVRSFIEDSVSFMSHGGQLDFYPIVKKYLDRLLGEVVDGAILRLVEAGGLGVSQAMQVAANMAVMERACDFFFRHAAQLSGIPLRIAERGRREFPLKRSRDAAEELLLRLLQAKLDDFMILTDTVSWMADDPPPNGNEYANEVIIYLETLVSTAQQILPIQVLRRVLHGVLTHVSEKIVGLFLSDSVKRFNANAVTGIDADLRLFESFADNQSHLFGDTEDLGANELKMALVEARQLVNLLMSNHPENFLNPVIREKSYNKLDYKKVATISEKFRDSSDRLFSTFGTRGSKQNPKKKSLDALIKRLKDVS